MSNNHTHTRNLSSAGKWLNAVLLVAAYAYLAYKLARYDQYDALWAGVCAADVRQWIALVVACTLVGANMWLEAYRWRYLCAPHVAMTMAEAQAQVYYGKLAGLWTPWKIGEVPGRLMLLLERDKWPAALAAGVLSGWLMTAVIVVSGVLLLPMCGLYETSYRTTAIVSALVVVIALLALPWLSKWLMPKIPQSPRWHQAMHALASLTLGQISRALLQAMARYVCWIVQMLLCMAFMGIDLQSWQVLCSVPLYYLLVTVTPSVGLMEAGVRASLAVVVWQLLLPAETGQAVLAAMIVWTLNTLLPLGVATIVALRHKNPLWRKNV